MSKTVHVHARCSSAAPPAAVFALLSDSSTYPQWSGHDEYRMERPAHDGGHGVGEIRMLRKSFIRAREEIIAQVENSSLRYRLLSGLPLQDYVAETRLVPTPCGGTRITWDARFQAKLPLTAWFWRPFMTLVLASAARGLARAAERSR